MQVVVYTKVEEKCVATVFEQVCSIALLPVDEVQELFPRLRGRPHSTEHTACCCGSSGLLHTTHNHTEMAGFDDDSDALRLQHLRQSKGDLLGQAFLDLQAASEHLGDTSEFGETDNATVGNVADVHLWVSVPVCGDVQ